MFAEKLDREPVPTYTVEDDMLVVDVDVLRCIEEHVNGAIEVLRWFRQRVEGSGKLSAGIALPRYAEVNERPRLRTTAIAFEQRINWVVQLIDQSCVERSPSSISRLEDSVFMAQSKKGVCQIL